MPDVQMKTKRRTEATIGLYEGSNEGRAIYLNYGDYGSRITGSKCWGYIKPIKQFDLSIDRIINIRDECNWIIRKMRAERRKEESK